jgi:hypothetical protein
MWLPGSKFLILWTFQPREWRMESPQLPADRRRISPETPRSTSDPGSEVLRGVSGGEAMDFRSAF